MASSFLLWRSINGQSEGRSKGLRELKGSLFLTTASDAFGMVEDLRYELNRY